MKAIITSFFASMIQVFLLCFQTINVVQQNIPVIGLTSIGISITFIFTVKGMIGNWKTQVALTLGGAIGAMASVPLHHFLIQ